MINDIRIILYYIYMSEECMELQNIEYQTMLLNGKSKVTSNKGDSTNIDAFLEKEKAANKDKPWSKLGKHSKIKKLNAFIVQYSQEQKCNKEEKKDLRIYLLRCLERKKLQRVKDITYDRKTGIIKAIPGLSFDKIKRKFTLKKVDRKNSSLKGLAPKRRAKTRRKKNNIDINLKIK